MDIKKKLRASTVTTARDTLLSATRTSAAKLPKLEVPTFKGDLGSHFGTSSVFPFIIVLIPLM